MGKLLPKVWRRLNGNIDCVCTRDFIQTKYSHIAMCYDSKSTKTLLYRLTDSLNDAALQKEDASQNT